eukprot:3521130-Amphidinium_carterae.1
MLSCDTLEDGTQSFRSSSSRCSNATKIGLPVLARVEKAVTVQQAALATTSGVGRLGERSTEAEETTILDGFRNCFKAGEAPQLTVTAALGRRAGNDFAELQPAQPQLPKTHEG